jgi:hypothetical protein
MNAIKQESRGTDFGRVIGGTHENREEITFWPYRKLP